MVGPGRFGRLAVPIGLGTNSTVYESAARENADRGAKWGHGKGTSKRAQCPKLVIADYLHFLSCIGSKPKRWIGLKVSTLCSTRGC